MEGGWGDEEGVRGRGVGEKSVSSSSPSTNLEEEEEEEEEFEEELEERVEEELHRLSKEELVATVQRLQLNLARLKDKNQGELTYYGMDYGIYRIRIFSRVSGPWRQIIIISLRGIFTFSLTSYSMYLQSQQLNNNY